MSVDAEPNNEAEAKAFRGWPDCTCPWAYKSLGRLYNVDMGKGWIRLTTDAGCPNHGGAHENDSAKEQR